MQAQQGDPGEGNRQRCATGKAPIRRTNAAFERQDAKVRELEESTERLRVSTADLQAFAQSTKADFKELGEQQRRQARMERYYRKVFYGDAAALRLQALQEDGRQRALSHAGISSSATAPDGGRWVCRRTTNLVQDWASTCQTVVLTQEDMKEIANRFGCQFISFLGANVGMTDMAQAYASTVTLSQGMPWAERYFIMEAIDNLPEEAAREGGRTTYLAFFGRKSWVDEWKSVVYQLGA